MVPKGERLGGEGRTGGWDGNVLKLGYDDDCTTIDIIKFIGLKNIQNIKYTYNIVSQMFSTISKENRSITPEKIIDIIILNIIAPAPSSDDQSPSIVAIGSSII